MTTPKPTRLSPLAQPARIAAALLLGLAARAPLQPQTMTAEQSAAQEACLAGVKRSVEAATPAGRSRVIARLDRVPAFVI